MTPVQRLLRVLRETPERFYCGQCLKTREEMAIDDFIPAWTALLVMKRVELAYGTCASCGQHRTLVRATE